MLLLHVVIVHGFQYPSALGRTSAPATIIVWAVNAFVQALAPKADDRRRETRRERY